MRDRRRTSTASPLSPFDGSSNGLSKPVRAPKSKRKRGRPKGSKNHKGKKRS